MAQSASRAVTKRTVRLVENDSLAVDLCPCGVLALHLGALTLRLHADGLTRLVQTLALALSRAEELAAFEGEHVETWRPRGNA